MLTYLNPPLEPRRGSTLEMLGVARISGDNQDPQALKDQEARYREFLVANCKHPLNLTMIATQGSGEYLDREELSRLQKEIESRLYDGVIMEDLARNCRRVHAYLTCELCEDCDTRLLALNDNVDTATDWRQNAWFAVFRHEAYNKDTALRIRRTLRNRFMQGGVFQVPIFGYIKPPGAKSDADVTKDPEAEPIYDEWFRKLENDESYSAVADWLTELGIPTGPYCRGKRWTGRMVMRVTFNPILKGLRVRNKKISKRINKTGRRRSVDAPPEERLERECPHLAFIEPKRYDRLIRKLQLKNDKYRRGRKEAL